MEAITKKGWTLLHGPALAYQSSEFSELEHRFSQMIANHIGPNNHVISDWSLTKQVYRGIAPASCKIVVVAMILHLARAMAFLKIGNTTLH